MRIETIRTHSAETFFDIWLVQELMTIGSIPTKLLNYTHNNSNSVPHQSITDSSGVVYMRSSTNINNIKSVYNNSSGFFTYKSDTHPSFSTILHGDVIYLDMLKPQEYTDDVINEISTATDPNLVIASMVFSYMRYSAMPCTWASAPDLRRYLNSLLGTNFREHLNARRFIQNKLQIE